VRRFGDDETVAQKIGSRDTGNFVPLSYLAFQKVLRKMEADAEAALAAQMRHRFLASFRLHGALFLVVDALTVMRHDIEPCARNGSRWRMAFDELCVAVEQGKQCAPNDVWDRQGSEGGRDCGGCWGV